MEKSCYSLLTRPVSFDHNDVFLCHLLLDDKANWKETLEIIGYCIASVLIIVALGVALVVLIVILAQKVYQCIHGKEEKKGIYLCVVLHMGDTYVVCMCVCAEIN